MVINLDTEVFDDFGKFCFKCKTCGATFEDFNLYPNCPVCGSPYTELE